MKTNSPRSTRPALLSALLLGLATATAGVSTVQAADRGVTQRFTEYADVIDVQAVFKDVGIREPRQECWIEQQQHLIRHEGYSNNRSHRYRNQHRSGGDAVVGGIIGGVIGNQLGRGSSRGARTGATVAGAIIGSVIANESSHVDGRHRRDYRRQQTQRRPVYETRPVERCKRVVDTRYEKRISAYDVRYRYRGQILSTRMNRDPGDRLELQVTVKPARQ